MELYSKADVELVDEKIGDITKQIEINRMNTFDPTWKTLMEVFDVIFKYIKTHKRKIYGGYAQNKLVVNKSPKDAFYTDDVLPDIDYYTPDPLNDIKGICDELFKTFPSAREIIGKEALHSETYTIHFNNAKVCDISYVPTNIFHKIPFTELDGLQYVSPSFMYIDMFRAFTDPYFSGDFRWKKVFDRLYIINKNFPFNKATSPLPSAYAIKKDVEIKVIELSKHVEEFFKDKSSIIVVGQYAYNALLNETNLAKTRPKIFKQIEHPFYQLISTNYIEDSIELYKTLKLLSDKITFKEYYPLWVFTGYNIIIYYDNFPIVHITSHNDRCSQVRTIKQDKATVQIGCFDLIFLYNLISGFKSKVTSNTDKFHYHNIMTSHLIEIRNDYFKHSKKTLLDNTLFQSFIVECTGPTHDPKTETLIRRQKKYEAGKMVVFSYKPASPSKIPDYKFANTSGNEISNTRNLKITNALDNVKVEVLDEE
jgi:hypothetical protein